MIDHKHARQPRKERVFPVAKTDNALISCGACRATVLCPIIGEDKVQPIPGWLYQPTPEGDLVFCSAECQDKGLAQPVRPRAPDAHIDWERGSKPHPNRMRGRLDALGGYDCLSAHPEYVKGHADGMAMREMLFATVEKLKATVQ